MHGCSSVSGPSARLEVLLDSARALNSTLDWDQVLHLLAERLIAALDAAGAAFAQVDLAARTIAVLARHAAVQSVQSVQCAPLYADPQERATSLDRYPAVERMIQTCVPLYGHVDESDF